MSQAFPDRIARTLTPLYETFFKQSLSELQLKVPQLRTANVQVTAPDTITWDCGISTVPIPAGKISRVWISLIPTATDATGRESCSQVEYFGTGPERIRELRAAWNTWISNSEGDASDARQPTAQPYYTIMDGVVALYPPVPDCWQVNVQWDGVNRSWSDTDDVSAFEDILVSEFSRLYTLWKSSAYEGCDQDVIKVRLAEMRDKLNDVIYDYRERETPDLMRGRYAESPACAIPSCGTVGATCDDAAAPPGTGAPACADGICGIESEGPGRYYGTGPGATDGGGFWDLPIPSFLSLPDVQPSDYSGNRGKMVVVNNTEDFLIFRDVPTGGGAGRFTDLTDAPDDYTGADGKLVAVNETDSKLEFINPPASAIPNFTDLGGTPSAYDDGKILVSTGTNLEWVAMPTAPAPVNPFTVVKLRVPWKTEVDDVGNSRTGVFWTASGFRTPFVILKVYMKATRDITASDSSGTTTPPDPVILKDDVIDAQTFLPWEQWGDAFQFIASGFDILTVINQEIITTDACGFLNMHYIGRTDAVDGQSPRVQITLNDLKSFDFFALVAEQPLI